MENEVKHTDKREPYNKGDQVTRKFKKDRKVAERGVKPSEKHERDATNK